MSLPRLRPYRGAGARRSGLVRLDGRMTVDDDGPFYPLGLTFMWSLQGRKYERARYEDNYDWAASKGFDFTRPLLEVLGGAWKDKLAIDPTAPEWADWADVVRGHLDYVRSLGMRSGITITGKGSKTDRVWLADQAGAIVADGREEAVIVGEMQNEFYNGGDPLDVLRKMSDAFRARAPRNLTALSSCMPGQAAAREEMKSASRAAGVSSLHDHTERAGEGPEGDYGWRDGRQPYNATGDGPLQTADWEGSGPGSSGAQLTKPLLLAMKRFVAAMCGAPVFTLHTGTGVYGDGRPSSDGFPRPPNFWEIANIDAIVSALRSLDVLMPPGMPNWANGNVVGYPLQPHAGWEGTHGEGVNKAYASIAPDGRWVQAPCGVRNFVRLTASYPVADVVVYDPLTLQPVLTRDRLDAGASFELPGGAPSAQYPHGEDAYAAYIIHGRRA